MALILRRLNKMLKKKKKYKKKKKEQFHHGLIDMRIITSR